MDRRDFLVEIIRCRPQGLETFELGAPPSSDPLDVTAYAELDGLSSINRAIDRDLLTMKTGDITVVFDNPDGYFDDVFDPIVLTPTTIWSLRVSRDGEVHFWGVLIGLGSIKFNRKDRQCEVTAYGLTKLLDMTSADPVSRIFSDMTVVTATAGSATLTLNTNISLQGGDPLHLTDHVNSEDVTIKQVLTANQVLLEAVLVNTYAAGSVVTCSTPFWRYKTIAYLVEKLYQAAGVPMADLRISNSQFRRLAPTPLNISGLDIPAYSIAGTFYEGLTRGVVQVGGLALATVHSPSGVRTYSQAGPDETWAFVDTGGAYADWSKYYAQGSAEPPVHLRINWPTSADFLRFYGPHCAGFDFITSPTKTTYFLQISAGNLVLRKRTTTDGTTWSGDTAVAGMPVDGATFNTREHGVEYDPGRGIVVAWWTGAAGKHFRFWDGAVWTDMKQGSDGASDGYFGACYVAELDAVLALRSSSSTGPSFEIAAFRGATRLWLRSFPACRIAPVSDSVNHTYMYPTRTLRSVAGSLNAVCLSDGQPQIVQSDDEFVTYRMAPVGPASSIPRMVGARINDAYYHAVYRADISRGYLIAAPFYAGVIEYADFTNISVAESLKKLAVLANAYFWIDDDLAGHFVARDLYDTGAVSDISDLLMERDDDLIWDQTAQFVTVSGNGFEATAGDNAFAADGIELESAFMPTGAFAQALADSYFDFFSQARKWTEAPAFDADGRIFRPLDRVTIDGERFLVYESDHDLGNDEAQLSLLEDR